MRITLIIRGILTLAMIYGAYTETGIWTALCLLGIWIAIEALNIITKRDKKEINHELFID